MMLGSNNLHVVLAVKDIDAAKDFYGDRLGLTQVSENPMGVLYQSGDSRVFVYVSEFAGTNKATAAYWETDDVAGAVSELKAKGIMFEHYDMEGVTHEGDIHVMGQMQTVWFKDPDGNILSISNEAM